MPVHVRIHDPEEERDLEFASVAEMKRYLWDALRDDPTLSYEVYGQLEGRLLDVEKVA